MLESDMLKANQTILSQKKIIDDLKSSLAKSEKRV